MRTAAAVCGCIAMAGCGSGIQQDLGQADVAGAAMSAPTTALVTVDDTPTLPSIDQVRGDGADDAGSAPAHRRPGRPTPPAVAPAPVPAHDPAPRVDVEHAAGAVLDESVTREGVMTAAVLIISDGELEQAIATGLITEAEADAAFDAIENDTLERWVDIDG